MINVKSRTVICPHCGPHTHLDLDVSNGDQDYYEECTNCCQEIHIKTHFDEVKRAIDIAFDADDEQFY